MKKFIVARLLVIPLVLSLLVVSCVDRIHPSCRIDKFFWEDQWHQAYYNSVGRLTQLIADSSKVYFHYDASFRLIKAEIYTTDVTPAYRFEYIHGPWGIVEINEYHPTPWGEFRDRTIIHYASPTNVDYLIREEYEAGSSTPGFSGTYTFTYAGGNITFIEGETTGVYTTYTAFKYDKKKNPFRALAASVGNPLFFPTCIIANFPVPNYDISFLSLFSDNNPLSAEYQIPDIDPEVQTFAYAYAGSQVKEILWTSGSYGTTTMEDYAFEYECGHRHGHDE